MKRYHVAIYAALFAICACLVWVGSSDASTVPQKKTLTAKVELAKWESEPISGPVYIHVYINGQEIPQRMSGKCSASYTSGELFVWVRLLECQVPGSHPAMIRYLSVSGAQKFQVAITRSSFG